MDMDGRVVFGEKEEPKSENYKYCRHIIIC